MTYFDNTPELQKNWFSRNRKWLVPVVVITITVIIVAVSGIGKSGADFAVALNDKKLYEEAVARCNENHEVRVAFGAIKPVDDMAILESDVEYGNNRQSVKLTIRVDGNRQKGRMDAEAHKAGNNWQFDFIKVRIKNPEQEIIVLE